MVKMCLLARFFFKLYQRFRGTFYEGPDPPNRILEETVTFSQLYPDATRKQWIAFTVGLARFFYKAGYLRGFEWAERDISKFPEKSNPILKAAEEDPNWGVMTLEDTPVRDDLQPTEPPVLFDTVKQQDAYNARLRIRGRM